MLHECVILPLPTNVEVILLAAAFFSSQYHCATHLEILGTIAIEGAQTYDLPDWHSIVRIDQELGLLGLGNLEEDEPQDDEALLWVLPTGPGQLRLSPSPSRLTTKMMIRLADHSWGAHRSPSSTLTYNASVAPWICTLSRCPAMQHRNIDA